MKYREYVTHTAASHLADIGAVPVDPAVLDGLLEALGAEGHLRRRLDEEGELQELRVGLPPGRVERRTWVPTAQKRGA